MKRFLLFAALAVAVPVYGVNVPPSETSYGYVDSDGGMPPGGGVAFADRPPAYGWVNLEQLGSVVIESGDDTSSQTPRSQGGIGASVTLGHPFPMFGVYHKTLTPTSNGYLTDARDDGSDNSPDCPFPSRLSGWTGGARIAPFHCDLDLAGDGRVKYRYFEASPHPFRKCGVSVFSWDGLTIKASGLEVSFQALLFDTGDLIFQYKSPDIFNDIGSAYSIGIHSANRREAVAYRCSTTGVPDEILFNHAVQIEPYEIFVEDAAQLAQAVIDIPEGGKIRFDSAPFETWDLSVLGGPVVIGKSLALDGGRGRSTRLSSPPKLSGNNLQRLFRIAPGKRVLISECELVGGSASDGGAVLNDGGILKLCGVDLRGHRASGRGGAVASLGAAAELSLSSCNILLNEAGADGGAVYAEGGVTLYGTTLFSNRAGTPRLPASGGGLYLMGTQAELVNCTFSNNLVSGGGAGLYVNGGAADLSHCTVFGNLDQRTSYAIFSQGGQLELDHCIVARNAGNFKSALGGSLISAGNNIEDGGGLGLTEVTDQSDTDPDLTPIGWQGGRVLTHLPRAASPAIDAGAPSSLRFIPEGDARGFSRVLDGNADGSVRRDIGAAEAGERLVVNMTSGSLEQNPAAGQLALANAIRDAPDGAHIVFDASLSGADIDLASLDNTYEPPFIRHFDIEQSFLFFDGSLTAQPVRVNQLMAGGGLGALIHLIYAKEGIVSIDSVALSGKAVTPVLNLYNSSSPDFSLVADTLLASESALEGLRTSSAWVDGLDVGAGLGGYILVGDPLPPGPAFDSEIALRAPDFVEFQRTESTRIAIERGARSNAERVYLGRCEFEGSDGVGVDVGTFFYETVIEDVVSQDHPERGVSVYGDFVSVERCSILNNRGGGLYVRAYDAEVRNSTISGNVLTVPVDAQLLINNSAPAGGTPSYQGGGAGVEYLVAEASDTPFDGSMRFEFCTVYDNTYHTLRQLDDCLGHDDFDGDGICNHSTSPDRGTGGILFQSGYEATMRSCIIARNRVTYEIPPVEGDPAFQPFIDNIGFVSPLVGYDPDHDPDESVWVGSLGGNLFDTRELDLYGIAVAGDLQATDPSLGPLFDHGGSAPSHMPLANSPAIDAAPGMPASYERDVRGRVRTADGNADGGTAADIGAVEADTPLVVTTAVDQDDGGSGGMSLREAVAGGGEYGRIIFHPSLNDSRIELGALGGQSRPIDIQGSMTIDATGLPRGVTVDAGRQSRSLNIYPNHSVAIHALSFIDGKASGEDGGGIANAAELLLTRSLIAGNVTDRSGGGIFHGAGSLKLHNVTIAGNSAATGSALANLNLSIPSGPIELRHCTVSGNTATAGAGIELYHPDTRATFASSIIAGNLVGGNGAVKNLTGSADMTSLGFNLIDVGGFVSSHPDDILDTPALLAAVPSDEGGFSKVLLPSEDSPAIDGGWYPYGPPNIASNRDARGALRQLGYPGRRLDIGAYETYSIDTDGDQIPDAWEEEHALDPNDPSDALVDGDCDGEHHLAEYLGGGDPWDQYGALCDHRPAPSWSYSLDGPNAVTFDLQSLSPPTQPPLVLGVQMEFSRDLENWFPFGAPSPSGLGATPGPFSIRLPNPRPAVDKRLFLRGTYVLDLAGVDLSGIDLSGVNFSGLDLTGVDFSGALLEGADFSSANLDGVSFDGASLRGALLYDALGSFSVSSFPGIGGESVEDSLPEFYPAITMDDYSLGHPAAPGSQISHNTYILQFSPGVTVAQANASLAAVDAKIVGALPPEEADEVALFSIRTDAVDHVESRLDLAAMKADANIERVAPEEPIAPLHAPDVGNSRPAEWGGWHQEDFSTGNWGMKYCRVPQLWNFNEAVQKRIAGGEVERITRVGMADSFVHGSHPDLRAMQLTEVGPGAALFPNETREHGTNVAGIIGANHANGGIEGVTPFARLFARSWQIRHPREALNESIFGLIGAVHRSLRRSETRVINLSLGSFNEQAIAASGGTLSAEQMEWLEDTAEMFKTNWHPERRAFIVNAGGNAGLEAKISTPIAYAALELGASSILVAEAVNSKFDRPSFSAVGGNISAPGAGVWTTSSGALYRNFSGTSASTPFVVGAISYLFSLQPDLTNAQMDQLMLDNRNAEAPGNGLDAWAAAMDIDRVYGGDEVLHMLLDIDDGSLDGNRRLSYSVDTAADQPSEDPTLPILGISMSDDIDADGGIGDGQIDMGDYRRARDWALIASLEDIPESLDGPANHFKHDANRNGVVEGVEESHYPRNDFNGDGFGDISDETAPVPGVLAGADATDLFVLRQRLVDPLYGQEELGDLGWETVDLHLALYWFAHLNSINGEGDFSGVSVRVTSTDEPPTFEKTFALPVPDIADPSAVDVVLSMPRLLEYEVEVCGGDVEVDSYGEAITFTAGQAGADHYFSPRAFPKEGLE